MQVGGEGGNFFSSVQQLVGLFTAVSIVLCFCSLASHCAKWVSVCVSLCCLCVRWSAGCVHYWCGDVGAAWSHQRGTAEEALYGDECNADEGQNSSQVAYSLLRKQHYQ